MHSGRTFLAVLVLLSFFCVQAQDDLCPNCPLDWDPVCGRGNTAAENTHANTCFANCSCELLNLAAPCILRTGECGTATIQEEGCPQLPPNIAPSHARREQLADASTWDFIIDVRTLTEFEGLGAGDNGYGRIPGAILAAGLATSDALIPSFPCKTAKLLVVCRTGSRSFAAVARLRAAGFTCVFNLDGGTKSWASLGYPTEQGAVESGSDRLLANSAPRWTQACTPPHAHDEDEDEKEDGAESGAQRKQPSFSLLFLGSWLVAALASGTAVLRA